MGLFTKTPQEKEEKILKSEQKADNKALRQALKDVERANKEELKAAKEEHGTIEDHQKAIRRVEKLVADMNKLQHEHESAVSARDTLARDVDRAREEHARMHQNTLDAKANLEAVQAKVGDASAVREERLEQLTSPTTASPTRAAIVGVPGGSPTSTTGSNERLPGAAVGAGAGAAAGAAGGHGAGAGVPGTTGAHGAPAASNFAAQPNQAGLATDPGLGHTGHHGAAGGVPANVSHATPAFNEATYVGTTHPGGVGGAPIHAGGAPPHAAAPAGADPAQSQGFAQGTGTHGAQQQPSAVPGGYPQPTMASPTGTGGFAPAPPGMGEPVADSFPPPPRHPAA